MKATQAQVRERVEEVLRIRLDGAEFHDVVQYASEKRWGVGERQLWNYVAASDRLLAARQEKDRDKLFARHVAQRRALYARAVNAADFRTALAVAKDEAELLGLYPAAKHEVTGKGGKDLFPAPRVLTREQFNRLTDEERLQYLRGQLPIEVIESGPAAEGASNA